MELDIVHVSDTHHQLDKIKIRKCEVLIHSGDEDVNTIQDAGKLNKWFGEQEADIKIFVPGNHDWGFQRQPEIIIPVITNAIVLIDQRFEYKGFNFWGSPWQPEFCDWAFNLPRGEELREKWNLIPEDTDVLITHGPPYGILDRVAYNKRNVGCEELLERIRVIKPKLSCFGHIHEGFGIEERKWEFDLMNSKKVKQTIFSNASIVNEDYRLVNKPNEIKIYKEK